MGSLKRHPWLGHIIGPVKITAKTTHRARKSGWDTVNDWFATYRANECMNAERDLLGEWHGRNE